MDKFNGGDPYGLLRGVDSIYHGNNRVLLIHKAWDNWDVMYGDGQLDYEVYALCNGQDAGKFVYGPLRLNYRPHYIGHGQNGRAITSKGDGRQKDKAGEKYYWLEQMAIKNKKVHIEILGQYSTKRKANIVEIKLLSLMKEHGVYLTNATYTWTQVPFNKNDFVNPEPILFA